MELENWYIFTIFDFCTFFSLQRNWYFRNIFEKRNVWWKEIWNSHLSLFFSWGFTFAKKAKKAKSTYSLYKIQMVGFHKLQLLSLEPRHQIATVLAALQKIHNLRREACNSLDHQSRNKSNGRKKLLSFVLEEWGLIMTNIII